MCRDYVKTLANNEQDFLKYLLKDKYIFIVINESEVDKIKFINVFVGDIDVLEKTYQVLNYWDCEPKHHLHEDR